MMVDPAHEAAYEAVIAIDHARLAWGRLKEYNYDIRLAGRESAAVAAVAELGAKATDEAIAALGDASGSDEQPALVASAAFTALRLSWISLRDATSPEMTRGAIDLMELAIGQLAERRAALVALWGLEGYDEWLHRDATLEEEP